MVSKKTADAVVVGAGPVGLLTALALSKRGMRVQIFDKGNRAVTRSYALALHPGTLELFEELGLLQRVLKRACLIRRIGLYDGSEKKAEMNLAELPEKHPYLAVMRQDELESLLEDALDQLGVAVNWNHRVSGLKPNGDETEVTVDRLEQHMMGYAVAHLEWLIRDTTEIRAPFVVGADGHHSFVRRSLNIEFQKLGEAQNFAVFEFKSDADLDHEMRIVMDDETSNVLWPMPGGHFRWSFQQPDLFIEEGSREKDRMLIQVGTGGYPILNETCLHEMIAHRAPWFEGLIDQINWRIMVRFEQRLADSFGRDRIWIAGDAGHLTGPVGVQSMNVGFQEGYALAAIIACAVQGGNAKEPFEAYNRCRVGEWRNLLGMEGGLEADSETDDWVARRRKRLLPCLPVSGKSLQGLALQLGLELIENSTEKTF